MANKRKRSTFQIDLLRKLVHRTTKTMIKRKTEAATYGILPLDRHVMTCTHNLVQLH